MYETGEWRKLPEKLMHDVPTIHYYGKLVTGSRIAFSTNASEFTLRCRVKMQFENEATSWLFGTGFNVYAGKRTNARYLGYLSITQYSFEWLNIEKTFQKDSNDMEDITIYLSSQVYIDRCEIIVDADAAVAEPTPYKYLKPVVFYGSSITAGGAASRVGNSYISLLSRWLDMDYINYGFPGNARPDRAEIWIWKIWKDVEELYWIPMRRQ